MNIDDAHRKAIEAAVHYIAKVAEIDGRKAHNFKLQSLQRKYGASRVSWFITLSFEDENDPFENTATGPKGFRFTWTVELDEKLKLLGLVRPE